MHSKDKEACSFTHELPHLCGRVFAFKIWRDRIEDRHADRIRHPPAAARDATAARTKSARRWRAGCAARPKARCCSTRPRAAATRPTRRSTRSCRPGCWCRKTERDIETAIAIARELKVPVLPRGAGTSQCGQTTGAALVIDHTRHFRRVIDIDADARTAVVQPGLVLDHLNAQLKSHGLWFPVDVSTSAQATLGGMAGNNSCGSRSIAYGNMVHNVLGASVWLSDGERVDFGPVSALGWPRARDRRLRARTRGHAPRRDRGALAQGDAPRGRLQPRHLPQPERAALHRRWQRQPGAPADRQRGHAGLHPNAHAAARRAAAREGAGCRATSPASGPRWNRPSIS